MYRRSAIQFTKLEHDIVSLEEKLIFKICLNRVVSSGTLSYFNRSQIKNEVTYLETGQGIHIDVIFWSLFLMSMVYKGSGIY